MFPSSPQEAADGTHVELWSFDECLPSHAMFVMFVTDFLEVLSITRNKTFVSFCRNLEARAGLPHRETSIKLMKVVKALMMNKLQNVLKLLVSFMGPPYAGGQSDVWSLKSCRESFLAFRLSMVVPAHILYPAGISVEEDRLVQISPLIGFKLFASGSHTGQVATPRRLPPSRLAPCAIFPAIPPALLPAP